MIFITIIIVFILKSLGDFIPCQAISGGDKDAPKHPNVGKCADLEKRYNLITNGRVHFCGSQVIVYAVLINSCVILQLQTFCEHFLQFFDKCGKLIGSVS